MNNQTIQLEAYRLIRIKARNMIEPVDDTTLGSYVKGIVDLQSELYKHQDNEVCENTEDNK